jgi:hypothetical protein
MYDKLKGNMRGEGVTLSKKRANPSWISPRSTETRLLVGKLVYTDSTHLFL